MNRRQLVFQGVKRWRGGRTKGVFFSVPVPTEEKMN